jgi:hypothetical protein
VGIASSRATLEGTVIQETSVAPGIKVSAGYGLAAGPAKGREKQSSVMMKDCLVARNTSGGITLGSATARIARTVVRDNRQLLGSAGADGDGIGASISTGHKVVPVLELEDCLVSGNRKAGISLCAGKGTISRTIVRSNLPRRDKQFGYGVRAQADAIDAIPSQLKLRDVLVAANHGVGVLIADSSAVVERSVVRDTKVEPADLLGGHGVSVLCSACSSAPSASIKDSLISRNHHVGVTVEGGQLDLERTVVSETKPETSVGKYGVGIAAMYRSRRTSNLQLTESVVAASHTAGVGLFGSSATLERCVVRDTRVSASGSGNGFGVMALNYYNTVTVAANVASKLTLHESLIHAIPSSAIVVAEGSSARIKRSQISGTAGVKGAFGDGLTVDGKASTLLLVDSVVADSKRAGLLVVDSGGLVRRSVFRRNLVPIFMSRGAPLIVEGDNVFLEHAENKVTYGKGFRPSALPDRPPSSFK